MAVGTGSSAAVQSRIQALGTNTLTVFNRGGARGMSGQVGPQTQRITITDADIAALNDKLQAPSLVAASPVVQANGATATYQGASTTVAQVIGTDDAYMTTTDRHVAAGRGITDDDVTSRNRVAVIGETTAANLFPAGSNVIGETDPDQQRGLHHRRDPGTQGEQR